MWGMVSTAKRRVGRILVAVALVATTGLVSADLAGAVGFTTQEQTAVATLNERSILIGGKDGGTATVAIPAGATVTKARLSFGAGTVGAGAANDAAHAAATITVLPGPPAGPVAVPGVGLLEEGGGYRYVADVTIPATTTTVMVGGIEGAGASWALLIIYNPNLPAGDPQRSQVTYREGFARVAPAAPISIPFTGLVPANPATAGTFRAGAAAGTALANEGVSFDPDGAGATAPVALAPATNSFDVSGAIGTVALNTTVTPTPGATTATASFAPPAGGDTYFVMVVAYEVTFSVAQLTLAQTLTDTSPPTAAAGDVVGVAVTVSNAAGRSAASNAVYSTTLPAGSTVAGGKVYTSPAKTTELATPGQFTLVGQVLTVGVGGNLPGGVVAAGSPASFYYEVATTLASAPTLTIVGQVAYRDQATNTGQTPAGDTDNQSVPLVTDLSVVLNALPPSSPADVSFPVTPTVTNNGPNALAAGEATVTIGFGTGIEVVGTPPAGCATVPAGVSCAVPALANGASAPLPTVTLRGVRPPGADRPITATVATTAAGQDPIAGNNTDSGDVDVAVVTDLVPTITVPAASQEAGVPFNVTATVTNNGPSNLAAGEAKVRISLPAGLVLDDVGHTCAAMGMPAIVAQTITCDLPAIASGATSPTAITASVIGSTPPPPGSRTITASALTNVPAQDPDAGDNDSTGNVVVTVRPNVTVTPDPTTQRVPFGDGPTRSFDTRFIVANSNTPSTVAVTNLAVLVSAPAVPAGTTLTALTSSSGGVCDVPTRTCTFATFAVNASTTITATWTAAAPGQPLSFTARATAPDPTPVDRTGTQLVDLVSVDLRAAVTNVPANVEAGPPGFVARFTGTNLGPGTTGTGPNASRLAITWTAGLSPEALPSVTEPDCVLTPLISPTSASCELPALAQSGFATFDIRFTGTARGLQTITVTAVAPGTDTPSTTDNEEPTSVLGNNTASATVNVRNTPLFEISATPPTQRVPVYPVDVGTPTTTFTVTYTLVEKGESDIDNLTVDVPTPVLPVEVLGRNLQPTAVSTPTGPAATCTVATLLLPTRCVYANFPISTTGTIQVTYTIDGISNTPLDLDFVAVATASIFTPILPPSIAMATARVTVVRAEADLDITGITYTNPLPGGTANSLQTGTNTTGTFDANITVRNLGPDIALAPTVTVTIAAGSNIAVLAGATCVADACTITGADLASATNRVVTITFQLTATNNAVHGRSAPIAASTKTFDPVAGNNTDTIVGTINRSPVVQPETGAASAPTVPSGGTLIYKTFTNGDTDPDTDPIALPASTGTITFTEAGVPAVDPPTVNVVLGTDVNGTITVTPTLPANTDPAVRVVKISIPVTIGDGQGGSTLSTLDLAVTEPVFLPDVAGSFGRPPSGTAPRSFGEEIAPDRIGDTPTNIDVLQGVLGQNADGTTFPAAPGVSDINYDVASVSADSLNVEGSAVTREPGSGSKRVIRYVPSRGYTSDQASAPNPFGIPDAPADSFTYRTSGIRSSVEIFTVDSGVTAEIKNQNPIGVDDTFPVPNGATNIFTPALNDLDGNTVGTTAAEPIDVKNPAGSFTFDDEGEFDPVRGLTIKCIGPVPPIDPVTKLPSTMPSVVCPDGAPPTGGFVAPGAPLGLEAPGSNGRVTVTLAETTAGPVQAFRTVTVTADDTVVSELGQPGELQFVYVAVDNYGGTGFGRSTVNVPNSPPQVIEGVRTVLKNTPTLVVDTRLATQDNNNDTIVVSGLPPKTKEGGTLVLGDNSRTITYTPARDFLGPDEFTYSVTDGRADGSASATLKLNVIEQPGALPPGTDTSAAGGAAGGAGAGGNLAATGGDPVPLTAAGGCALVLGLLLVQASRRRQTRPLLDQARHLRS